MYHVLAQNPLQHIGATAPEATCPSIRIDEFVSSFFPMLVRLISKEDITLSALNSILVFKDTPHFVLPYRFLHTRAVSSISS
jgi:hypothetical protein